MFGDLKSIVDLIRTAVSDISKSKSEKEREKTVLDLLRVYFVLKDCVDEGAGLIEEAGADPIGKIGQMDEWTAASTLDRWDAILNRQIRRLRLLQGAILGQYHIAVINPSLQDKIDEVIGSKMERANSLHGIGATLVFRFLFDVASSNEERARYVTVMAGAEDNLLDMDKVGSEISELRQSLDQYRSVIERFLSNDEIVRFSRQARLDTLPRPEA